MPLAGYRWSFGSVCLRHFATWYSGDECFDYRRRARCSSQQGPSPVNQAFFADPYYRKSSLDAKAIALQYVCIIIPMIAVAALIEGFVTPALLRLLVH